MSLTLIIENPENPTRDAAEHPADDRSARGAVVSPTRAFGLGVESKGPVREVLLSSTAASSRSSAAERLPYTGRATWGRSCGLKAIPTPPPQPSDNHLRGVWTSTPVYFIEGYPLDERVLRAWVDRVFPERAEYEPFHATAMLLVGTKWPFMRFIPSLMHLLPLRLNGHWRLRRHIPRLLDWDEYTYYRPSVQAAARADEPIVPVSKNGKPRQSQPLGKAQDGWTRGAIALWPRADVQIAGRESGTSTILHRSPETFWGLNGAMGTARNEDFVERAPWAANNKPCFTCGGPHWGKDCPKKPALPPERKEASRAAKRQTTLGAAMADDAAKAAGDLDAIKELIAEEHESILNLREELALVKDEIADSRAQPQLVGVITSDDTYARAIDIDAWIARTVPTYCRAAWNALAASPVGVLTKRVLARGPAAVPKPRVETVVITAAAEVEAPLVPQRSIPPSLGPKHGEWPALGSGVSLALISAPSFETVKNMTGVLFGAAVAAYIAATGPLAPLAFALPWYASPVGGVIAIAMTEVAFGKRMAPVAEEIFCRLFPWTRAAVIAAETISREWRGTQRWLNALCGIVHLALHAAPVDIAILGHTAWNVLLEATTTRRVVAEADLHWVPNIHEPLARDQRPVDMRAATELVPAEHADCTYIYGERTYIELPFVPPLLASENVKRIAGKIIPELAAQLASLRIQALPQSDAVLRARIESAVSRNDSLAHNRYDLLADSAAMETATFMFNLNKARVSNLQHPQAAAAVCCLRPVLSGYTHEEMSVPVAAHVAARIHFHSPIGNRPVQRPAAVQLLPMPDGVAPRPDTESPVLALRALCKRLLRPDRRA